MVKKVPNMDYAYFISYTNTSAIQLHTQHDFPINYNNFIC